MICLGLLLCSGETKLAIPLAVFLFLFLFKSRMKFSALPSTLDCTIIYHFGKKFCKNDLQEMMDEGHPHDKMRVSHKTEYQLNLKGVASTCHVVCFPKVTIY